MLDILSPLLKPKPHSILGIDISSASVKLLEISSKGDKLFVEGYGREDLPSTAFEEQIIKDIDAVSTCIKSLCYKTQVHSKQVALAVPDSSVISKVIQMNEGLSDEEMEELVLMEADKFIPYPINEINLDFEIQGHNAKNSAMLDVLIVASRAENISARIDAVTRAGLEPKVVDVESFAVERASQRLLADLPKEDKTIAIIDLGAHYTYLFVLHKGILVYSREEKFGGMQLIDAISEHYQMSPQEALAAKYENKLPEDYDSLVLKPFKESILLQLKRTLQFFYSSNQQAAIDHVMLAGGLSKENGLAEEIQDFIGIKTSIANPFSQMGLGSKVNLQEINRDAPSLMVACGLALRNIE